jgi:hypothetical protein
VRKWFVYQGTRGQTKADVLNPACLKGEDFIKSKMMVMESRWAAPRGEQDLNLPYGVG